MNELNEKVLVAYFEPHVYVRVGTRTDDEGRRFESRDQLLLATIRTTAQKLRGKIKVKEKHLYVIYAPKRVQPIASAIFREVLKLPQYHCQLRVPNHERPGRLVFCAANLTLKNLQRAAKDILRQVKGSKVEITWPYLTVRYSMETDEIDVEVIAGAELGLPPGQRNSLQNLKF